ncbi:MAG TPA: lactate utilization protein [Acidobacteriota bacterium]|nr:lactate utilization protein [Acidobacteriota bacterium]
MKPGGEIDAAAKALRRNNFNPVITVDKARDAVEKILEMIPPDASIELAGSASVSQLGLMDLLRERGNRGLDFPGFGTAAFAEMRKHRRDVLLVSANAVTLDGKIVNIDGMGNRVSAMIYGVDKVILLVGANKIVRDVPEAIERVQKVISPYHAKHIGVDTPCARTELCSDCESPQRICNITTVITKKPPSLDFAVVLTEEDLGLGWDPSWPAERIENIKSAYRAEMEKFRAKMPPRKQE